MPRTPYQLLLEEGQRFRLQVEYPRTYGVWTYPKDKLSEKWTLADLYERTAAANTLGYDTKLVATDKGLEVKFVKRPELPVRFS